MKKEDAVRCSTPILKTLLYSTESDAPTQFFSYTGNNAKHSHLRTTGGTCSTPYYWL